MAEVDPPLTIVIFSSGEGSNFTAIADAISKNKLRATIAGLFCDQPTAGVLRRAETVGVQTVLVQKDSDREHHENDILKALLPLNPKWIVLAGYMRLLSKKFLSHFWDENLECFRVINIHPSLLPSFPGKDSYRQALEHGVKITGVTVHLLNAGCDDGPIVAQAAVEVLENDTQETLRARGLAVEHRLYSETLERIFYQPWRIRSQSSGRQVFQWLD